VKRRSPLDLGLVSDVDSIDALLEHLAPKSYRCSLCGHQSDRRYNMRRHIELTHCGGGGIACALCPFATKSKAQFKHHCATMHGAT
jgi:hypothetical protein